MGEPRAALTVLGACPHDCPDTCGIVTEVIDGVAVSIRGSKDHPVTQGFLCAKVNRYLERTYHPDRVLQPMRRVGAKGEGRFEPATWDEALSDIAARLRSVVANHGPQAVLPYNYSGTLGMVQGGGTALRFFHRLGASLLDRTICATAGSTAWTMNYGRRVAPPIADVANSRLILLWGTNTLTSNPHLWPFIDQARHAGARVIAIDPIRTRTARACDEHIAVVPGTDAALALGMMHVIFRDDLHDQQFLAQRTTGHEGLRARAESWTPDRTAEVCGVNPEVIERLAHDYATTRPAFIRLNYGLQRHYGGGAAVRVVSLLPAVTGSWREVGGGACLSSSGAFSSADSDFERMSWVPPGTRSINMVRIGEALTKDDSVQAMVVWNSNPAAVAPDLVKVREGLRRDDLFLVVHEHFQTDTADFADWLLPATTQLEHWDVHKSYGHNFVALNAPAIEPVGESLSNNEFFRRLARAMGMDDPEFGASDRALVESLVTKEQLSRLDQRGWFEATIERTPYAHGDLPTPSGLIHIDESVDYVPPAERGNPELPLTLLSPPEHGFLNSTFVNIPALARKAGEQTVHINPDDAAPRGIISGDRVRAFNARGEFEAVACVCTDVRPGVVASYGVRWSRTSSGHTVNDTTSQRLTDIGGGATFYDNAVQIEALNFI